MKKDNCWFILLWSLVGIMIIFIIVAGYSQVHQGGWYCEYCREGSHRPKWETEQNYGFHPCKFSEDSCHHFVYYFSKPVEKPKYIK